MRTRERMGCRVSPGEALDRRLVGGAAHVAELERARVRETLDVDGAVVDAVLLPRPARAAALPGLGRARRPSRVSGRASPREGKDAAAWNRPEERLQRRTGGGDDADVELGEAVRFI